MLSPYPILQARPQSDFAEMQKTHGLYGLTIGVINGLYVALALMVFSLLAISPARAQDGPVILALGDSLVAGYGLTKADSFPTKLETALKADGINARVINAGVSGDTSKGGLSRVDWLLVDKPDLMIIELGANDGLRGQDPASTEANIAGIIEKAQAADIRILLTGMRAPPNLGKEYEAEFNAVFPRLAERYDTAFYPFFLDGVAGDLSLNLGDGMHPNAAGVDVIVERILPSVISTLQENPTSAEGS